MSKKITLIGASLITAVSLFFGGCLEEPVNCSNVIQNGQPRNYYPSNYQTSSSQECDAPSAFDTVCMNDLLDASKHSDIYNSMIEQCTAEGKLEDEFFTSQNTTALDEIRESFMNNNPLGVLGERIEFSYGRNGGIALDSSGDGIIYTEFNEGSEFNDFDITAYSKFVRFFGQYYSRAQVDSLEIRASRLTDRGLCNIEGVMADIARRAAFSLDDPEDVFMRGYYQPIAYFSIPMQSNGDYIFYTNDRIFWVSNDILVELYDYMNPEYPQPYEFTTWELVNAMLNNFPSTIYSAELAENVKAVFDEHKYELVENGCIPPD